MAPVDKSPIFLDHEKAQTYSNQYINKLQNQITARGLILTNAIQEFSAFIALPPSSSIASAIFDFAFTALSTAIPAFRIGEFIKKQHERASVALKAAEAFGQAAKRSDRVIKTVGGIAPHVGEGVKHVKDGLDIREKADKLTGENASTLEAHASLKPVLELIKELNDATASWDEANKAEMAELENRINGLSKDTQSLESKMKDLLTVPPMFTDAELREIRMVYLHLMVSHHVMTKPIRLITTRSDWGYGQYTHDTSIDGWNDTQRKQIVSWFGTGTQRGKFFMTPAVVSAQQYLERIPGFKPVLITRQSGTWSPRAKI